MLHHSDNAPLPGADRAHPQPVPPPPPPAEQTETANVPGPSPDPRLLPPPGLPAAGDPQPSTLNPQPTSPLVPNTLKGRALSPKAPSPLCVCGGCSNRACTSVLHLSCRIVWFDSPFRIPRSNAFPYRASVWSAAVLCRFHPLFATNPFASSASWRQIPPFRVPRSIGFPARAQNRGQKRPNPAKSGQNWPSDHVGPRLDDC